MDSPIFDDRFFRGVVQAFSPKSLGWDCDDVVFGIGRLELWLCSYLPFVLHDFFDSSLAEAIPFPAEPISAHVLERLINENTATEPTYS